ncbi:MAG: NifU family protein [Alphaproteobacteria bacterium]|nr:NifU family protein [Alphaproteobacteria bacterium]
MLIDVEETYNSNVRNFYLNTEILRAGCAEYADIKTENSSELAQNILNIEGVLRVLILPDMVFVEKKDEADFDVVAPQVMAQIVEFDFAKFKGFDFSKQNIEAQAEALVEARVRPFLKADGGNIEILRFSDGVLYVRLEGRCKGCPHARETLKNRVEAVLKKYIAGLLGVREEK